MRVDLPHPDFIAHPPGARTAVVVGPDESLHIVDVMSVARIQIGPPTYPGLNPSMCSGFVLNSIGVPGGAFTQPISPAWLSRSKVVSPPSSS